MVPVSLPNCSFAPALMVVVPVKPDGSAVRIVLPATSVIAPPPDTCGVNS